MNFKNRIKKIKEAVTPEPEYVLHPEQTPGYKPMTTQIPDDYKVEIVKYYDDDGKYIGEGPEPSLSSIVNATDLDRLRWLAAVVNARHPELNVEVTEGYSAVDGIREDGYFSVTYYRTGTGGYFDSVWTMLTGLENGMSVAKTYYNIKEDNDKSGR